jgi:DNA-binding NtrC family response regulator
MSLAAPLANFPPVGMRANVLIVDDDSGFRDTLEDLLVDEGYTATVARNKAHALGCFRMSDDPRSSSSIFRCR